MRFIFCAMFSAGHLR